jgi:hypothetical protein
LAEALETMNKHGRRLLRWWWCPVGPKLVLDQMEH